MLLFQVISVSWGATPKTFGIASVLIQTACTILSIFSYDWVTYLLTYMALQPRFGQGQPEKIPLLYSISSEVHAQSQAARALLSLFTLSAHLDFGFSWFRLPSDTTLNRALCGRSSVPLSMCSALRKLLFTTSMYVLQYTPSTIFGPYIVRTTFPLKTRNRFSYQFVSIFATKSNETIISSRRTGYTLQKRSLLYKTQKKFKAKAKKNIFLMFFCSR
jgi:hypothetical protein